MMEFTAEMIAGFLGGDIVGDKTVKVHTVSSIEEGKAGSMAYLVNPKYEPFLYTTEASIVLVDRSFTPQREVKPTLVKVDDAVEMNRDNIYGVTTFLNNAYAFLSPEEVMEQIALFPAEWQQRRELTELREATERKLRVSAGHPYIDIAAKNADGGEVSLKSVVENRRNKYVLLDFWASWCGPCMAEIPFLKADYEKYGKKGFEIYAVSFDSQRDRWIDAVRQQGMKWIQVSDLSGFQTPAAEAYAVQSIPSNFLIRCSDGQIVATQLRGEALGEKLGELLGD